MSRRGFTRSCLPAGGNSESRRSGPVDRDVRTITRGPRGVLSGPHIRPTGIRATGVGWMASGSPPASAQATIDYYVFPTGLFAAGVE